MHDQLARTIFRTMALALLIVTAAATSARAQTCAPSGECGDVDTSGSVVATDALLVLKHAVGQAVPLDCACTGGSGTCANDLAQCQGDLATCNGDLTACKAPPACGDGVIGLGEHCDGSNLGAATCVSLGHVAGTLACSAACEFDTSACNECAGLLNAGTCWYLGAQGQSCEALCAGVATAYDNATQTAAGSGGTNAACETLLDALGAPGTGLDNNGAGCSAGYGCAVSSNTFRARCSSPATDSTSASPNVSRVCACR